MYSTAQAITQGGRQEGESDVVSALTEPGPQEDACLGHEGPSLAWGMWHGPL